VQHKSLCSQLSVNGANVATIEHLLSAIYGADLDNLSIILSDEEVPIMDGSARDFTEALRSTGSITQDVARRYLNIRRSVTLTNGDSYIEISSAQNDALSVDFTIDFAHLAIGRQTYQLRDAFAEYLTVAEARTFGFLADKEQLHARGLALGADESNVILLNEEEVVNRDGLRYKDEFVRHKVLDLLGDIMLAGYRVKGHIKAYKSGHRMTHELLKLIFAEKDNYQLL